MTSDDVATAWGAVHEALPARWQVGPVTFDPGRSLWSVTAVNTRTIGRGRIPQSVTGTGDDEAAALHDLDDRLRGVPKPDGTRMEELRRQCRLAYYQGAEAWSRANTGGPLEADHLARVIERFPG